MPKLARRQIFSQIPPKTPISRHIPLISGHCRLVSDYVTPRTDILKQERNNQKVKYILTCLEIQARRAEGIAALGDELEPSSTLTIEHIFPKGIGAAWRPVVDADPTVPDECTYKLGNICLLTSINKSLGTAPFDEKKGAFTKSDLILTREIAAEAVWNRRSIDQRQARLAGLAVAFWRFQ